MTGFLSIITLTRGSERQGSVCVCVCVAPDVMADLCPPTRARRYGVFGKAEWTTSAQPRQKLWPLSKP